MDKGKKIYDNIQRLAYAKGFTINALCDTAHVSVGMLGDLAHGRRNGIGNITIQKLCKVLECTPEDILSEATPTEPMPDRPPADRTGIFIARASEAMRNDYYLRRLVRAAMKATPAQVRSTAVLLESITGIDPEDLANVED